MVLLTEELPCSTLQRNREREVHVAHKTSLEGGGHEYKCSSYIYPTTTMKRSKVNFFLLSSSPIPISILRQLHVMPLECRKISSTILGGEGGKK